MRNGEGSDGGKKGIVADAVATNAERQTSLALSSHGERQKSNPFQLRYHSKDPAIREWSACPTYESDQKAHVRCQPRPKSTYFRRRCVSRSQMGCARFERMERCIAPLRRISPSNATKTDQDRRGTVGD